MKISEIAPRKRRTAVAVNRGVVEAPMPWLTTATRCRKIVTKI